MLTLHSHCNLPWLWLRLLLLKMMLIGHGCVHTISAVQPGIFPLLSILALIELFAYGISLTVDTEASRLARTKVAAAAPKPLILAAVPRSD